jgi:hypothetical protein
LANKTKQLCRLKAAMMALILSTLALYLVGCANWQVPPRFDVSELQSRAVTAETKGVRLSAAVLSREDSIGMFGADLNKEGIQPVWIDIENSTDQTLWLLRTGTDPDIFSPLEVAWSFHGTFSGETNARIDRYFNSMSFQNPIAPHSKQSGVLFTNPHREIRLLNIDLLGQGRLYPFTLFPEIPDDTEHKYSNNLFDRLANKEVINYEEPGVLRSALEQSPCCATNVDGMKQGQPLNVVAVGNIQDISAAMVRRGFRVKILAPDNSQYVYDRPPDVVLRKSGQGGVPENWVRAWLAPFRYQGKAVFLVQAGRPVGGRFREDEASVLNLHPDVDEIRDMLIGDMMYSGGLGELGFVTGVGEAGRDKPRKSFDGTSYYTDGIRAVMIFVTRPRSISEVHMLDWYPAIKLREAEAVKEARQRE